MVRIERKDKFSGGPFGSQPAVGGRIPGRTMVPAPTAPVASLAGEHNVIMFDPTACKD